MKDKGLDARSAKAVDNATDAGKAADNLVPPAVPTPPKPPKNPPPAKPKDQPKTQGKGDDGALGGGKGGDDGAGPPKNRGDDGGGGGKCSFVPGTQVTLADGSAKPIEQVKLGDQVIAEDPVSGLPAGSVPAAPRSSAGRHG